MPNRFANDVADVATDKLIKIYNSVDEISSVYSDSTQFIDAVYNVYSDEYSSNEELENEFDTPWNYILDKLKNTEDFIQGVFDNLIQANKKAEHTYTIFDEVGHIDWPRLKEEIIKDLEAEGFDVGWGTFEEIIIEFLLDEIGPQSVKNVSRRYELPEEDAERLLKYLADTYSELQWLSSNEETSLEDFQKASNITAGSKQFQVVFEDSIGGQGVFNIDAIDETEAQQIAEEVTKDHPNIKKIIKIREAEKSAQEADFDKELPMEVTEVQRSQKTSDYNEGDVILYQGSIFLVLSVGEDYYNLGNLLETPYKDEDVAKDIVDHKSLDLEGVQGAEQLIESGEESPGLLLRQLNKGLEAFEIYKGKIWEKESAIQWQEWSRYNEASAAYHVADSIEEKYGYTTKVKEDLNAEKDRFIVLYALKKKADEERALTKRDVLKKVINKGGEFYADYDEGSGFWHVFDTEEGFAFGSFIGEKEAEAEADNMNKDYGLGKYKKADAAKEILLLEDSLSNFFGLTDEEFDILTYMLRKGGMTIEDLGKQFLFSWYADDVVTPNDDAESIARQEYIYDRFSDYFENPKNYFDIRQWLIDERIIATKKTAGTELWQTPEGKYWLLSTVMMEKVGPFFNDKDEAIDWAVKNRRWTPDAGYRVRFEEPTVGSPEDLKKGSKEKEAISEVEKEEAERESRYEVSVRPEAKGTFLNTATVSVKDIITGERLSKIINTDKEDIYDTIDSLVAQLRNISYKTSAEDGEKKPHETVIKEPEYEHQLKRPSAIPQPKEVAYLAGQAKEALTKIYKRTIKIREIKDEISKMNAALKTEQAAALPEVKGYLTMAENAFKKADLELNRVYAFKTEVGDPLMTAVYQSPARDIPAPGEVFFNKKDANIILQLLKQNGKITDEVIAEMEVQVDKMNENVKYVTEVSRKIYTWPPSKEDLKKLHEGATKEAISFIDRIKSAWFGLKKFMNKITTLTDEFSDNTETIRRMLEEKGVV